MKNSTDQEGYRPCLGSTFRFRSQLSAPVVFSFIVESCQAAFAFVMTHSEIQNMFASPVPKPEASPTTWNAFADINNLEHVDANLASPKPSWQDVVNVGIKAGTVTLMSACEHNYVFA